MLSWVYVSKEGTWKTKGDIIILSDQHGNVLTKINRRDFNRIKVYKCDHSKRERCCEIDRSYPENRGGY